MNTEERQLAEMLHRVTPEPRRQVTVEDVAFRLANQAGPGRGPSYERRPYRESRGAGPYRNPHAGGPYRDPGGGGPYRDPRLRRPSWGRAWAPALAAASVFLVAGATAGIAVLASSHHGPASPGQAAPGTTSSSPSLPAPSSPARTPTSTTVAGTGTAIPGAPWGARLVDHLALLPGSLTGSGASLYAFTSQALVRIDPATGAVIRSAPLSSPVMNAPVVRGSTVWVVSSYGDGRAVLTGYNAQTLDRLTSVTVPALGPLSAAAQGVLAAGPDGNLYVAAGNIVAVVSPANGALVRRIQVLAGAASSVAVSPDGSRLYVSTFDQPGAIFQLLTYNLTEGGVQVGSSKVSVGAGGNLVATEGGVWGTLGSGMGEWVWFAPGGDLSSASPVTRGAGGGFVSLPSLAGGAVWIGGTSTLSCADPGIGSVRASGTIHADHGAAVYFGSVASASGHAYAYYIDNQSQTQGLATLDPPAACTR